MKDTFDLKKFLKESKALENTNPLFQKLNENKKPKTTRTSVISEEWKSDFDGNRDFNEYAQDELDFENKYGNIYDYFDSLDKEISFSDYVENKIFNKMVEKEMNSLKKVSNDEISNAQVEKIRANNPYTNHFRTVKIWVLPNNNYAFWSDFKQNFLAGNNKEEVIKLAFIERNLLDQDFDNNVNKQTSRAESGWVDENILRDKIREMVLAELDGGEDYELEDRKQEYGINPEMDDLYIDIEDDLYEAKNKKKDEATEDAEDIEDVELPNPDEFTSSEPSPEDELSTAASYATGDSKELINNLMSALESSKSTGNEKLTTQILNTLKFAIDQSINTSK